MMNCSTKQIEWTGLYSKGWQNEIVPEAFSHPAKMARGLVRKIYQHLFELGYLKENDHVLDPFGGIGGTCLDALVNGCHWTGIELEQKFVDLGNQNIALWNKKYGGKLRKWGTAQLLQGDSRELLAVLGRNKFECAVSSLPFSGSELSTDEKLRANMKNPGRNFSIDAYHNRNLATLKVGNVDSVISSPPFMEAQSGGGIVNQLRNSTPGNANQGYQNQGNTPGNLSAMKPDQFDAAISSPPFLGTGANDLRPHGGLKDNDRINLNIYGHSEGQLGQMKSGTFDAITSSPPYYNQNGDNRPNDSTRNKNGRNQISLMYSTSKDNIGNDKGDTFWSAAKIIVEQTHLALKPNGVAAWVVKSFVRSKKIVDFPGQWRALCESIGFETIEEIHAMLIEEKGTQIDTENNHHTKIVERKSFFRRLAESKGSPKIDFETVYVMRKREA